MKLAIIILAALLAACHPPLPNTPQYHEHVHKRLYAHEHRANVSRAAWETVLPYDPCKRALYLIRSWGYDGDVWPCESIQIIGCVRLPAGVRGLTLTNYEPPVILVPFPYRRGDVVNRDWRRVLTHEYCHALRRVVATSK